jgi:hypothetical protein
MSEKVVAIYCFLDDFFLEIGKNQGSVKPQAIPKVSDSIVLTTAMRVFNKVCQASKLLT